MKKKLAIITPGPNHIYKLFNLSKKNINCDLEILDLEKLQYDSNLKKLHFNGTDLKKFDVIYLRSIRKNIHMSGLIIEYLKDTNTILLDPGLSNAHFSSENKAYMSHRLLNSGIPIPSYDLVKTSQLDEYFKNIDSSDYPVVLKSVDGYRCKDLYLIDSHEKFDSLNLREALWIVQKYIESDGDYRLMVIGDSVVGTKWRKPGNKKNFRAKISEGGERLSVTLPISVQKLAIRAAKISGWSVCGVDLLKEEGTNKYYVLETNRVPGLKNFMQTTGVNVADKILEYMIQL